MKHSYGTMFNTENSFYVSFICILFLCRNKEAQYQTKVWFFGECKYILNYATLFSNIYWLFLSLKSLKLSHYFLRLLLAF